VSEPGTRRTRAIRWAGVAAGVALVLSVIVVGPPGTADVPLDPDSAAPGGLLGVVQLLEDLGVEVDQGLAPPADRTTRVFVPIDLLNDARREALLAWTADGGTLVVADPRSRLHDLEPTGAPFSDLVGASGRPPACPLPAVAQVETVEHAGWTGLTVPAGATGCFPLGDDTAWLVVTAHGQGTVVVLGSAAPLVNGGLDRADNAVLAAALLGPAPGDQLRIVPRPPVGDGDVPVGELLLDLLPPGAGRFTVLLLLAVVALVVWRARRLGAPVSEDLPPVLPSAELAHSLADLMQRAGGRQDAADRLRRGARADAARALGVPTSTPAPLLVDVVTARTATHTAVAERALIDGVVEQDDGLVALARATATVRRAVVGRSDPVAPSRDPDRAAPRAGAGEPGPATAPTDDHPPAPPMPTEQA
jgi:hypothetical protein